VNLQLILGLVLNAVSLALAYWVIWRWTRRRHPGDKRARALASLAASRPFSEIQTLQDMQTRQAAHDAAIADKAYRRANRRR